MKTTIEVKDYLIVIEETENEITVTATKDDDTIEEFSLEIGEVKKPQDEDEDIKSFDDFDEEDDFDDEMKDKDEEDKMEDEENEDEENEDKKEIKLESFQAFMNRKRK